MNRPQELESIEGMDIYLIDQIMKGRYQAGESILDAGAGGGRNLNWFSRQSFNIHACDIEAKRESLLRSRYPEMSFTWETADLSDLPYEDECFDHIICNAVLHFAHDESHFQSMWNELLRTLKTGGTIFIRTCSNIGIEEHVIALGQGRYRLPDGSDRFLINREMMEALMNSSTLEYLEALKSLNVDDQRVMTTIVASKRP